MIRRALYRTASALGDANAIVKGKVGKRIVRKLAWRLTGKLLRRLFR